MDTSISHDVPPTVLEPLCHWPLATVLDRSSQDNICLLCEVVIQNLMCGYILGLRSVIYYFWVTSRPLALVLEKSRKMYVQSCQVTFPQMTCICHITVKYPVYHRLKLVRHKPEI